MFSSCKESEGHILGFIDSKFAVIQHSFWENIFWAAISYFLKSKFSFFFRRNYSRNTTSNHEGFEFEIKAVFTVNISLIVVMFNNEHPLFFTHRL